MWYQKGKYRPVAALFQKARVSRSFANKESDVIRAFMQVDSSAAT